MSKKKPQLTPNEERALQPSLLDVPSAEFVAKLEADGNYTGERLREQRPDTYQRVLSLLSQGHGSQYIQDQTGVSKNTVKAVRKCEGETIDLLKARIAERNFEFAEQADDAAASILGDIMSSRARRAALTVRDVQSLKVAAGIAVQNGQLLTGKPTANVSVEVFSNPSEDLNKQLAELYVNQLQSAATHSGAEKNATKGGAVLEIETATASPSLAIATASPISAQDDKQSPDDHSQPTE